MSDARGSLGRSEMPKFTAETLRTFVPLVDQPYESGLVYEGVFTARQCARIVELGLSLSADDARIGESDEDQSLMRSVDETN